MLPTGGSAVRLRSLLVALAVVLLHELSVVVPGPTAVLYHLLLDLLLVLGEFAPDNVFLDRLLDAQSDLLLGLPRLHVLEIAAHRMGLLEPGLFIL